MSWQSTPLPGLRISASTAGRSAKAMAAPAARRAADRAVSSSAASSRRRGSSAARCEGATLPTWLEMSFSRRLWNAPPSGTGDVAGAVPAQLDDGRLVARELERGGKPGGGGAGVKHEVAIGRRVVGRGEADAERARQVGARADRCRRASPRRPSMRAQRTPTSAPTTPAPTTAMRPDGPGRRVPGGVERGLHVGGEHRARRRHAVGQRQRQPRPARRTRSGADAARTRCGRQRGRPGLDLADRRVAVFHRERERARHEWRAHALIFALRHPAGSDQRLGARG